MISLREKFFHRRHGAAELCLANWIIIYREKYNVILMLSWKWSTCEIKWWIKWPIDIFLSHLLKLNLSFYHLAKYHLYPCTPFERESIQTRRKAIFGYNFSLLNNNDKCDTLLLTEWSSFDTSFMAVTSSMKKGSKKRHVGVLFAVKKLFLGKLIFESCNFIERAWMQVRTLWWLLN